MRRSRSERADTQGFFGRSSNGRTADSDSAYLGSNPSLPATHIKPLVLQGVFCCFRFASADTRADTGASRRARTSLSDPHPIRPLCLPDRGTPCWTTSLLAARRAKRDCLRCSGTARVVSLQRFPRASPTTCTPSGSPPRRSTETVGFHSFRKTTTQALQGCGLSDERRRAYLGHAPGEDDSHATRYMRPWTPLELADLLKGMTWASGWISMACAHCPKSQTSRMTSPCDHRMRYSAQWNARTRSGSAGKRSSQSQSGHRGRRPTSQTRTPPHGGVSVSLHWNGLPRVSVQ